LAAQPVGIAPATHPELPQRTHPEQEETNYAKCIFNDLMKNLMNYGNSAFTHYLNHFHRCKWITEAQSDNVFRL